MSKVYELQDALRIRLTAETDTTGATVVMQYIDPEGGTGTFTPVVAEDLLNGIYYYDFPVGSGITPRGAGWKVWLDITFSDGRRAPGEPYEFTIYREGD